ncbi:hypothetical protein LTR20_010506 [Exophiala xenobiotica]|nr:hypothetical protein LTR98_009974 [Exophiala xenobiotica]KAK5453996.1 hypothetical protein LTR20_010506 [Exophiala xenobiotica]KAK5471447.1 hypothetical protein LTR55_010865 [Exophiala xenobiotica]KAK5483952.1 hypothetical protein LTR26_006386 [Exophiala xenobiotica]KAK5495220.1 hypothetical protein LTR83_005617 [Exophiala xenobiotica]
MPTKLPVWPFKSLAITNRRAFNGHDGESNTNADRGLRKYANSTTNSVQIVESELPKPVEQARQKTRTSIWLSATTLGLTACLFTVFGCVLVFLWLYNSRKDGFALITYNHYSWTYGPTAILILAVALWRQIDYHCKAAIPWMNLQKQGVSGASSILLDYISALQIVTLWKSTRNGDLLTVVTIIGFMLLKLITLASTGLLAEQPTTLTSMTIPLHGITRLDGSLYNETQYIAKADSSLVYTAFGIMSKSLPLPEGTTNSLVYETFDLPPGFGGKSSRVTAQVGALMPDFKCEPAEVSLNPSPYDSDGSQTGDTMVIVSPGCRLMGGAPPVFVLDANSVVCPQRQFRGNMVRVNCSSNDVEQLPNWQLLTLAEVIYNQTLNSSSSHDGSTLIDDVDILSWSVGIKRTTSLLCQPSYKLGKLNTTYMSSPQGPTITASELTGSNSTLAGFHDEELALTFTAALTDAAIMFGDPSEAQMTEDFPNTMFKLMASVTSGSYDSLLDQESMAQAAQSAFQHIAVQVVSRNLLRTENSTLQAELESTEDRLQIDTVALWIMISGFAAMLGLCLLILYMRPNRPLPPRLETIGAIAQILARSDRLQSLVRDATGLPEKEAVSALDEYSFCSQECVDSHGSLAFTVYPFHSSDDTSETSHGIPRRKQDDAQLWWKPLMVRRPILITTLILPLAAIATLEILQRRSDNEAGILTLSTSGRTQSTLATRLIPALLMLIIATSFNSLDFNISVLAPFNAMRFRAVSAEQSINCSLIDKLPPIALWNAAKHRQYAALCSSTAAIIGSIMTIVVSGLYTVQTVPGTRQATLQAMDAFNTSWADSATNDSSAAVLTSLTESLDLAYPAFTYDQLAFPVITSPRDIDTTAAPELLIKYPALRASMICSSLDSDSFNVSASYVPQLETSSATVDAQIPLPKTCPFGGPGGNLSFVDLNYRVGFQQNTSYIGKLLDIHVGPYDAIQGSSFGEASPTAQKDNPPGCPSLALIYGYVDVHDTTRTSVTTLVCYQQMQSVQTTVRFGLPEMTILSSKPPIPDESTVELLPSSEAGATTFSYRIQQHMDQSLSLFNQSRYPSANLADTPVDGFFQGVLFGQTPLPETALVGQDQADIMMKGINAFYRRYMAQAISNNMRVANANTSATSIPTPTMHQGTILNASQTSKLVQHRSAKLALQILLGLMTLFGALAWKLSRLVDIVPYNPCTIFGKAALLAGSQLCQSGSDWEADVHHLPQNQQRTYKLDWWDDDVGQVEENTDQRMAPRGDDREGLRKRKRYGIDVIKSTE